MKKFFAIIISIILMFVFTYVISSALLGILSHIPFLSDLNFLILWLITSTIIFSVLSGYNYAVLVMPLKKVIQIGPLQFNNYFYDPELAMKKDNENYFNKYNELKDKYNDLDRVTEELLTELIKKDEELKREYLLSEIFIRHHVNSSRLVRSLTNLIYEGKSGWKYEFINNVLDECGTVLMKNDADKSSSVYFINEENELEMYAYNRIEFSSSRNRKFKRGEGFAGHIWEINQSYLVDDVEKSDFFKGEYVPKHRYGSIIGIPISIGEKVYGVLNIQSEHKNAFTEDDLVSARFYADICTLAHLYDILINTSSQERSYEYELS